MNRKNQFVYIEKEEGFSYIEVLIAISILAICIVPILSMIFNAAKTTISGKQYYEAVIMAQNLNEEVKKEIERKLMNETPLATNIEDVEQLYSFLGYANPSDFEAEFGEKSDVSLRKYDYEVYIKKIDGSTDKYKLFQDLDEVYKFIHINNDGTITDLPAPPSLATELTLLATDYQVYFATSLPGATSVVDTMDFGYSGGYWEEPSDTDHITIKYEAPRRYEILVTDNPGSTPLATSDIITLNLDATKADSDLASDKLRVRLENKSKANVLLSIYRLSADLDKQIEVFPIQDNVDDLGDIFIERKTKVVPQGSYIIGIRVKDRRSSKVLKEMIDIYAHDYRIATY
ncbi:MAG: hypothetical protein GX308_02205 [Epulopiscium sp.]|nr:hypothetical protein [Candidatus Epulonipiscium sp.]